MSGASGNICTWLRYSCQVDDPRAYLHAENSNIIPGDLKKKCLSVTPICLVQTGSGFITGKTNIMFFF